MVRVSKGFAKLAARRGVSLPSGTRVSRGGGSSSRSPAPTPSKPISVTRPDPETGGTITVNIEGQVTRRGSQGNIISKITVDKATAQRAVEEQSTQIIQEVEAKREAETVQRAEEKVQLQQQPASPPETSGLTITPTGVTDSTGLKTGFLSDTNFFPEEQFTTTLKRGAKSTTIFEGKTEALTEPSELSLYEKIDLRFAGKLPGGVTEKFAENIRSKEFTLRDTSVLEGEKSTLISAFKPGKTKKESQLRGLLRRDVIVGTTAATVIPALGQLATVAGAGKLATSIAGKGAVAFKNLATIKGASLSLGKAGIIGTGSVGVVLATKKIGRSDKILTETQQSFLADPTTKLQIREAIDVGLQAESNRKKQLKAIDKSSFRTDIRNESLLEKAVNADIQRSKVFEFSVRQSLIEEGFKGGKLEEAVSLTKQLRATDVLAEVAGVVTASAGSEIVGRLGVKEIAPKVIPKVGTKAFKNFIIDNINI